MLFGCFGANYCKVCVSYSQPYQVIAIITKTVGGEGRDGGWRKGNGVKVSGGGECDC